MFTKRTIQPHRPVEHTDTAVEALAVSMNERARVDLPYMAQLCGKGKAEIATELQGVGITANYSGFFYTSYAVYLAARQPERLLLVTKWLYPEVAEQYHKAWKNVERGIRTAASLAWKEHRKRLEALARCPLPQKPSASKFIAILVHALTSNRAA